jgi:peptidase E
VQTVILGSDRFDCLPTLLGHDSGDTPAVCVPTAADVLEDQAHVREEMGRLAGMGFPVTALPLAGTSKETVTAQLQRARLVFVTGGNAFHLLHHAILCGFTDLVPPLVMSATLV